MKTIYLSGSISSDQRTFDWRYQFKTEIYDFSEYLFEIINPCDNAFNKQNEGKPLSAIKLLEKVKDTQNLLKHMDYANVGRSDIMVVNLNDYGKPLIGTLFELSWARDVFKIPVIAIQHKYIKDNPYTIHPFITECLSYTTYSVTECVDLITSMF